MKYENGEYYPEIECATKVETSKSASTFQIDIKIIQDKNKPSVVLRGKMLEF